MSAIFLDVRTVRAQIAALRANHPELDTDTKLLEDSLEGQTDFRDVITRLIRFEREAAAFVSAITSQEKALYERRSRYARQQQIYRSMIQSIMEAGGQGSVRLPEATVSISSDRAGCVVTDENALPNRFVKIQRIPNKAAILDALLSGEQVPGAERKNTGTHLTIRT